MIPAFSRGGGGELRKNGSARNIPEGNDGLKPKEKKESIIKGTAVCAKKALVNRVKPSR